MSVSRNVFGPVYICGTPENLSVTCCVCLSVMCTGYGSRYGPMKGGYNHGGGSSYHPYSR